jgi:hypothetical protein
MASASGTIPAYDMRPRSPRPRRTRPALVEEDLAAQSPPLLPKQRDQLAQRQEEESETGGVEGVRKALADARNALDRADDALDEIESEAR